MSLFLSFVRWLYRSIRSHLYQKLYQTIPVLSYEKAKVYLAAMARRLAKAEPGYQPTIWDELICKNEANILDSDVLAYTKINEHNQRIYDIERAMSK